MRSIKPEQIMQIVTQFPHQIVEDPDMAVPMPDGCRLSARVWMPKDACDNPMPAVLEYIPYRKRDGTIARDEIMHKYVAGRGYVVIRLDMRGNGESQGLMTDEYTPQEQQDAVDAIAWIAQQPWCDGNVGMMGKSWGGFNGLQVAAHAPPALKAIITVCSSVDRYADDIHYKGGCLLNDNFAWGSVMLAFSSRPPDPMLVGDKWREMWLERLENEPFLTPKWLSHQRRDDYWKQGSICEDYSSIKAAVLSFGGWADFYMNTVSHLVSNLSSPVKGIVGPWVHQYPHQADPAPQIGFLQEAVRWWDHWLKGVENGVDQDPAYTVWMQDTVRPKRAHKDRPGHWVAEQKWPSARVSDHVLHLGQAGSLATDKAEINVDINSPLDCGFGTGRYFPMSGDYPEMPGDQRDDDSRSACFDSAPLTADFDILGSASLKLRLKTDKPEAQVVVRLCEVHPDGASTRITIGFLNLTHRNGHENPEPLVPGEEFTINLPLDHIAYRVKAGMRLRVAVSSAYWPFVWPSPEMATLSLLEGALNVPQHSGSLIDERQFEPAEGAEPWKHDVLREPNYQKSIVNDLVTGEISQIHDIDEGLNKNHEHGWISGSRARETWRIHPSDPLCASAQSHHTQELARDDWSVRTETYSRMWSDHDTYYLTARIEAYEGEKLVFERDFEEKVARDCS
ncbi:MAG: putative CocE/NonD family hydrolase [Paracoccaceae bacterium]|jgi:putative CocE/NonD family hydrolase